MDTALLCLLAAFIVFVLEAFHLTTAYVSWTPLGFAFVVLAFTPLQEPIKFIVAVVLIIVAVILFLLSRVRPVPAK